MPLLVLMNTKQHIIITKFTWTNSLTGQTIMITMKHIMFLTRCTWYFSLFCIIFMVLCRYYGVMPVYCVCFKYLPCRRICARNWDKNNIKTEKIPRFVLMAYTVRFPWRDTHGRDLALKKNQRGWVMNSWRSPWGHDIRYGL